MELGPKKKCSPEVQAALKEHCQDELVALFEASSVPMFISTDRKGVAKWVMQIGEAKDAVTRKLGAVLKPKRGEAGGLLQDTTAQLGGIPDEMFITPSRRGKDLLKEAMRQSPVPVPAGEVRGEGAPFFDQVPEAEALRLFGGQLPDTKPVTIHAIPDEERTALQQIKDEAEAEIKRAKEDCLEAVKKDDPRRISYFSGVIAHAKKVIEQIEALERS